MRLAYSATIHPRPRMPIEAISTASGAAPPAPLLAALMPTSRGIRKAMEKTGPMNPIDCATASGSLSLWCVSSRSYDEPACCDATEILLTDQNVRYRTNEVNGDHTGPNDLRQDLPAGMFPAAGWGRDAPGPARMMCYPRFLAAAD